MKRSVQIIFGGLMVVSIAFAAHAQSSSVEVGCDEARETVFSAMQNFRTAYFQRRGSTGSAESVFENELLPSAEQLYGVCPEDTAAAIRSGVEKANASLFNPRRGQLVDCDRALIEYQELLSRYDRQTLSSYSEYRDLLNQDVAPAARSAVNACPQMSELSQETSVVLNERQRRLYRMEQIEGFGNTMADDIAIKNEEYAESLEDD